MKKLVTSLACSVLLVALSTPVASAEDSWQRQENDLSGSSEFVYNYGNLGYYEKFLLRFGPTDRAQAQKCYDHYHSGSRTLQDPWYAHSEKMKCSPFEISPADENYFRQKLPALAVVSFLGSFSSGSS